MNPIVIRVSRWRYVLPLIGCAITVAVSIFMLTTRGSQGAVWAVGVIALFVGGELLRRLLDCPTRLIIDRSGIWYFDWQIDVVRWDELQCAFVRSEHDADFLCFVVRETFRQRISPMRAATMGFAHATSFGDLHLNTTSLGISSEEVLAFAQAMIAKTDVGRR